MTDEQSNKLRGYYHSLSEQKKVLDETAQVNSHIIDQDIFLFIADELEAIDGEFPGLVRPLDRNLTGTRRLEKVRITVASAIGRIRASMEEEESTPVTQKRTFHFISNVDLRVILDRDYSEIQRAFISKCWKSVIILSGGAIEAILLDLINKNLSAAVASARAPKTPDPSRWDLKDLINVSVDCKLVSSKVEKLSDSVREFRNLIHPGNEVRNKLKFDAEEARIALEVLNIVHRELA